MTGRLRFGTVDQRAPKGRPKRWRARYDDPTWTGPGRPPRITAPETFPTKAAAEAWLASVWAQVAAGTWTHPDELEARRAAETRRARTETLTIEQWAAQWLADLERTRATGTVRKRRSDLRVHILPELGSLRLVDLTTRRIAAWHSALPSEGVRAASYQTLRAMLSAAVDSDDTALTNNPCRIRGASAARRTMGERYLLSPAEVAAITRAIRPDLSALVILLADAGLRINEALALHRDDLRLGTSAASVDVAHSLVRTGADLTRGPTKTKRSRRVQVTPSTAVALADHLARFAKAAIVFPAPRGGYMRDSTASKALRTALSAAGVVIPPGRYGGWHAFRHYAATRYGQAGASTSAIMIRFGWTRPEQAMHYQRADADYERMILDQMASRAGEATWAERAEAVGDVVRLEGRRRA